MKGRDYAYFVNRPRTIHDLCRPHRPEEERAYEIVKVVRLSAIDYENFITDMLVDRQFIEDYSHLCAQEEVWKCLFISEKGHERGVLVMPEGECFVGWAAKSISLTRNGICGYSAALPKCEA